MTREHTETSAFSRRFARVRKVTRFSRYFALSLCIALPFIGGWIGYNYAPVQVVEVPRSVPMATSTDGAKTISPPHNWYETTRDTLSAATSTAVFTGSFQENDMTAWDRTVQCRQLYLRDYPQNELHRYYVHKALAGNTVQRFAHHGLLLNLPWDEIPELDRQKIRKATARNPISLRLQKQPEIGRGASACHSFFSYQGIVQ
jgi:hypothetical protein